ncbi:MAG: alpha-amylase family glycosyl hydrolase [Bacteroidales bacterium]|nr:alpha-amylase family glycosyl hydrolase [Bacteroidales bacterium]
MKLRNLFASAILAVAFAANAFAVTVDRMDPPFWYTGMKNHELQVMLYGKDISKAEFSLEPYSGVKVKEVAKTANPNYLWVYLEVGVTAKPGTMTFLLKEGKKTTTQKFELKDRNNKVGAQGFTTKDVLYLIMPDRYSNGNPGNDDLDGFVANRQGGGHHGGDLQGIKEHLDYIDDLGVTAIWLNPVQYNRGNASHGYSISDYYLIDPRLGSNEEYCDLIDAAHGKNIKVVMDMIFNHSGSSHWWISDVPDTDWFNQNDYAVSIGQRAAAQTQQQGRQGAQRQQGQGMPQGGQNFGGQRRGQQNPMPQVKTIEEFNALSSEEQARILGPEKDPNALVTTTHYKWSLMDPHAPKTEKDILVNGWFSGGMPDLNQRNRHLAKYMIQNSIWWIEYSRIDGIRMDTYPYADYDFMVRWCDEIAEEYPDFNIVGEGWYPRNSAAGWWQRNSEVNPKNPALKTVMDFDLTFTAQAEILKESNTKEGTEAGLFKIYETISQDFLIPDPNYVLTFLDNHDITRFMKAGDPIWKFKQGLALLLTSRGIPQIYYGTEIAMGGNKEMGDDQLRADFPGGWKEDTKSAFTGAGLNDYEKECLDYAKKLLNWRRTSKAVTEGKLIHYTPDNNDKCYVYAKTDGKNTVLVILNGSDTLKALDMSRFTEVIGANTKGKDVTTGAVIDVTKKVLVPARAAYVLDLSK